MTKLLLILIMVGLWGGCGKEIEVRPKTQARTGKLTEEYEFYRAEPNKRRVKHGYYKSCHEYQEDETYKETGSYVEGKKEGKWIRYDDLVVWDEVCAAGDLQVWN